MSQSPTPLVRATAGLIALITLAALIVQYVVSYASPTTFGPIDTLWRLARFFTILTNSLTAITFARIALGRAPSPRFVGAVVLSIAMVGAVYHLLLSSQISPTGADWVADVGLHTVVPLLAPAWWLVLGDKRLVYGDLPWWLVWPLGYCLYAMARGQVDGVYPYFFLDLPQYGLAFVARYIAGIALAFALGGLIMIAVARLMTRAGAVARP